MTTFIEYPSDDLAKPAIASSVLRHRGLRYGRPLFWRNSPKSLKLPFLMARQGVLNQHAVAAVRAIVLPVCSSETTSPLVSGPDRQDFPLAGRGADRLACL